MDLALNNLQGLISHKTNQRLTINKGLELKATLPNKLNRMKTKVFNGNMHGEISLLNVCEAPMR